ncbi:DsbE family thiol:disulfide interchange protein [Pseudomaricurvus sp. HS19]|uniref:DsbE family thiol:disulfide interchange protein n=1 Tax=Pseudomaricurvus sp. HS19 TaxID=2692626 RepID=UPI001367F824|nr:DsbE family thiol:disulfide interchange protein [Pseudomaricurvus sp. HS19]MYM62089.1 DsbE family thiol:disulfide interchange protein [Pseudomaricurvus sp. HS19]
MSRLKLFLPLAVFGLLAGLFWRGLSLDPTAMPSALIDKPMPAFDLPLLQEPEARRTQAALQGQVSLVNVWATWCVACKVEHPYLVSLAQQGVNIIGLNYKDDSASALKWLQELGNPYQFVIVDQDGRLGIDLGVFGAPETYLVDKRGMIRYRHVGVIDERVWNETLLPLVQELNRS